MQSFIEKQYKKDRTYIWNTHLGGSLHLTSRLKPIENTQTETCDAKFLGKKYKVYKDPVNGVTLIPADLTDFSDDFGPVIQYSQNIFGNPGFSFTSMTRINGVVETKVFTFTSTMSQNGLPQVLCQFGTFADENNDLERAFIQSGKTLPHFIASHGHMAAAKDPNTYTVKIERDKEKTRWNSGVYRLDSMTQESLEDYFSFPYELSDNKSSMIKLAEAIYQTQITKKDAKQKQKA